MANRIQTQIATTRLYTIQDVSVIIGMSAAWVREEARKGRIPGARKFGEGRSGRWRFQPEKIEEWLREEAA